MKRILFVVGLVAVTGLSILARSAMSGGAEAARSPVSAAKTNKLLGLDKPHPVFDRSRRQAFGPSEGAMSYADVTVSPVTPELQMARLAARHGARLLEQAGTAKNGRTLLRQATAHFRACLAYEEMAPKGEKLFRDARSKLARAEAMLAKPATPRTLSLPRELVERNATPVVAKRPTPPAPLPIMVGPDGVIYRRADTK